MVYLPAGPASRNRAAAKAIALAVDTGLLPDPATGLEIMEALGLIEPGGREILPDPHDLLLTPSADDFLPLGKADPSKADVREPPVDRRLLPPGLRTLSARNTPTQRPTCGSPTGYRAHMANGENACLPCHDAWRDRARERRAATSDGTATRGAPRTEIVHGTEAGHAKHRRRGIPMCEPCRAAEREARKARLARREPKQPTPLASPIQHGTNAGYLKERRHGLGVCDLCRRAATEHRARNRAAQRQRERWTQHEEKKTA